MSRSRILIITYSYAPHLTPRALRWSALAEYFVKIGFDVDVVCSLDPGLERIDSLNDVKIYRTGNQLLEKLRFYINQRTAFNMDNKGNAKEGVVISNKKGGILSINRFLRWLYKNTWPKIYWPDYAWHWYFYAVSKISSLFKHHNYDAVISVSSPFTGHLVGYYVKRKNPEIIWVVDIGDPFCFEKESPMNNQDIYNRLNIMVEKSIFDKANIISVTNVETKNIYVKLFYEYVDKINVIGPLLRPAKCIFKSENFSYFTEGKINLAFIGNFHIKTREPDPLLKILSGLITKHPKFDKKIEMHFFGNTELLTDRVMKYEKIHHMCNIHGPSSHSIVQTAMNNCDFLVNVSNNTSYQLPSKLIEYVGAAKPILNIYTIENDITIRFLKDYPYIININASSYMNQLDSLAEFLKLFNHSSIDTRFIERFVSDYSIENIAGKYLDRMQLK